MHVSQAPKLVSADTSYHHYIEIDLWSANAARVPYRLICTFMSCLIYMLFAYAKTKVQISCTVTVHPICSYFRYKVQSLLPKFQASNICGSGLTWFETQKTGFLVTRLICFNTSQHSLHVRKQDENLAGLPGIKTSRFS